MGESKFKVGDKVAVRDGHRKLVAIDTVRLVNRHHVMLTAGKNRYRLYGCEVGDGWHRGEISPWTPDDDCELRMNVARDRVGYAAILLRERKYAITEGNAAALESAAAALESLVSP